MHEDEVTDLDGIDLSDRHLRSHALQHHCGCLLEGDRLRQSQQLIGLYEPFGTARPPNLHRMSHTDFRNNMNSLIL